MTSHIPKKEVECCLLVLEALPAHEAEPSLGPTGPSSTSGPHAGCGVGGGGGFSELGRAVSLFPNYHSADYVLRPYPVPPTTRCGFQQKQEK